MSLCDIVQMIRQIKSNCNTQFCDFDAGKHFLGRGEERRNNKITVPRFNSYFLKNSMSYRGAILWNAVSIYFNYGFPIHDFLSKCEEG